VFLPGSSERRGRRKFTDEFEADVVALIEESGGQIAKVAKEIGIYDSSLSSTAMGRWSWSSQTAR
jgi:transposase-like protein